MINVEIKARSSLPQHESIRKLLKESGAMFKGTDMQTDTYFEVPHGRLKLREGNIENCLIQYERPDQAGPKISKYRLTYLPVKSDIRESLTYALGVLAVVHKTREIYFIDIVKIHLDVLTGLGCFIEIEVRDELENIGLPRLQERMKTMMEYLGVKESDLVHNSYSDMVLSSNK